MRLCTTPEATEVLKVDVRSLDLTLRTVIPNASIVSLRQSADGHLFAASRFSTQCRLEKRINFGELTTALELKPIFESNNVNSLEANDIKVTTAGVVILVGTTRPLPATLTGTTMNLEQLKSHEGWDESNWETIEQHGKAFVLAISKDGTVLGDRVFTDLRTISALAGETPQRSIAVGTAFGDRGWAAGLKLGDQLKPAVSFHQNGVNDD
jgi:hypothetical protein